MSDSMVEGVINAASSAWKIIEGGRPSAALDGSTCNAVPKAEDWTSHTAPQGTNVISRVLHYTNGFNLDVVLLRLQLRWEYGSHYHGGGAYIPNCWISVPQCQVLWGYSLDLSMHVHNPTRAGTDTAPNARLPLTISGTVSTPFWSDTVQWDYVLYGSGQYEQG